MNCKIEKRELTKFLESVILKTRNSLKFNYLPAVVDKSIDEGWEIRVKDVLRIFNQLQKAYRRYCYQAVAPLGIRMSETICILFLFHHDTQDTAHAIAEYSQLSPSMVSKSIERLREQGYLSVQRDRDDNRLQHLHLTEKAAPVVERLAQAQIRFISAIAQGISAEEFQNLVSLAERMQTNLLENPQLSGTRPPQSDEASDWK